VTQVTLIAAVASNGVIGDGPNIPWHLPEDFAFFKRTTMGHVLVMGRLTFESIGRPLPRRRTIVITRDLYWQHPDVEVAHSFPEALSLAGPADEVFVCGGGQVYAEAMPFAHRLLITEVFREPSGDVFFPSIPGDEWVETARHAHDELAWVTYEPRRQRAASS
jgi:dihydrofolate reductase